jgi:hypothetical protein
MRSTTASGLHLVRSVVGPSAVAISARVRSGAGADWRSPACRTATAPALDANDPMRTRPAGFFFTVSQVAPTGNLTPSHNPLRIGGSTLWGEFFARRNDDVRP